MRRLRKSSAVLLPALALGGALTVAPAFAAPAPVTPEAAKPSVLGCGDHRHDNKDGGSGHAQGEQVNIYSGPHNNCKRRLHRQPEPAVQLALLRPERAGEQVDLPGCPQHRHLRLGLQRAPHRRRQLQEVLTLRR